MSNDFSPSFDEPSRELGTPLTDFWGTGAGWGIKTIANKKGGEPFRIMTFRFAGPGFKVVSSSIPYAHETAKIEIFYTDPKYTSKRQANRGINEWTAYSDSVKEIFEEGLSPTQILDDMFGGRVELSPEGQMPSKAGRFMHWSRVPTLMNAKNPETDKFEDQTLPAWKVVEVEGIGNGNIGNTSAGGAGTGALEIMSYALDLANGKSEVDFYATAMDDMKILGNSGITEQLNKRSWVSTMISMGQLKNQDGILVRA